jgi:hypothetical protein
MMVINVQQMLDEAYGVLIPEQGQPAQTFVEKWVPEVVNEINDLRNKVLMLETRVTELEGDLEAIG